MERAPSCGDQCALLLETLQGNIILASHSPAALTIANANYIPHVETILLEHKASLQSYSFGEEPLFSMQ